MVVGGRMRYGRRENNHTWNAVKSISSTENVSGRPGNNIILLDVYSEKHNYKFAININFVF